MHVLVVVRMHYVILIPYCTGLYHVIYRIYMPMPEIKGHRNPKEILSFESELCAYSGRPKRPIKQNSTLCPWNMNDFPMT